MRFRLIRRGTAAHSAVPEKPAPAAPGTPAPPKASDLDNPYGRYYGTARKREDMRKGTIKVSHPSGCEAVSL